MEKREMDNIRRKMSLLMETEYRYHILKKQRRNKNVENGVIWAAIIIIQTTLMFWNIYIGSNFANIIEVIGLCYCIYGLRKYFKRLDCSEKEMKEYEMAIEKFKKDINFELMASLLLKKNKT